MSDLPRKRTDKGSKKARSTSSRLHAVQAVYQSIIRQQDAKHLVKEYIAHRFKEPLDDGKAKVEPDAALFSLIVSNVTDRHEDIVPMVMAALNSRKKEGHAAQPEPLLKAIILCGACELLVNTETDSPVIISDYIDIAHAFYEGRESKLVNAVLDRIHKGLHDTA